MTKSRSNAVAPNAKGTLVVGNGTDASTTLAVASTAGFVLTVDSAETTGLKWAAAAGGGKVLQVVSATYSTQASMTSTTYADTGLSASITPSATSSKVLVLVTNSLLIDRGSAGQHLMKARIVRDSTQVFEDNQIGGGDGDTYIVVPVTFNYLDSPSTTSATTYKMQYARAMATGTAFAQYNNSNASIVLLEIGA